MGARYVHKILRRPSHGPGQHKAAVVTVPVPINHEPELSAVRVCVCHFHYLRIGFIRACTAATW